MEPELVQCRVCGVPFYLTKKAFKEGCPKCNEKKWGPYEGKGFNRNAPKP